MDLNPYQFKASFHDFEFAKYHMEQNTELLLCCMSWVGSKNDDAEKHMSTIEYWAIRMSPMLNRKPVPRQRTIFVASNRHGLEEGK